jgi:hypothetical protein
MRRGGMWRGLFRAAGAGVKASSKAIPGGPMVDIGTVLVFVFTWIGLDIVMAMNQWPPDVWWWRAIAMGVAFCVGLYAAARFNSWFRKGMADLMGASKRRR